MNTAKFFGIMDKLNATPLWIYIAAGATVGLVIGIFIVLMKIRNRKPVKTLPTLDELLRKQIVCKTLTADRVIKWVDKCDRKHPDVELVFFIGRVKKETLPMFTSSRTITQNIEPENYMFIEAVDNGSKFPLEVAIVNCSGLDDTLYDILGDDDSRLIRNDKSNG